MTDFEDLAARGYPVVECEHPKDEGNGTGKCYDPTQHFGWDCVGEGDQHAPSCGEDCDELFLLLDDCDGIDTPTTAHVILDEHAEVERLRGESDEVVPAGVTGRLFVYGYPDGTYRVVENSLGSNTRYRLPQAEKESARQIAELVNENYLLKTELDSAMMDGVKLGFAEDFLLNLGYPESEWYTEPDATSQP